MLITHTNVHPYNLNEIEIHICVEMANFTFYHATRLGQQEKSIRSNVLPFEVNFMTSVFKQNIYF